MDVRTLRKLIGLAPRREAGPRGRRPAPALKANRRRIAAADSLWALLRSREFRDWRFRRQHPLGPFVVDYVCIEQALVIELAVESTVEWQEKRRQFLEQLGYRVLRFAITDVLDDLRQVRQAITRSLQGKKWGHS